MTWEKEGEGEKKGKRQKQELKMKGLLGRSHEEYGVK